MNTDVSQQNIEQVVEDRLMAHLPLQELFVTSVDAHFKIIAIGDCFEDAETGLSLSPVKKQQMIYSQLMDLLKSNDIHAVSIETYTTKQWERQKKLHSL